ncbi:hypothetical protein BKA64DRAFT_718056 [Cadophora sp. MPI-SDFR-AT-0126]|nr:hypothetical protein BKA64DRAFT_718056 [Leotiomycetes sp. MPI-SDFR-AT-0126]
MMTTFIIFLAAGVSVFLVALLFLTGTRRSRDGSNPKSTGHFPQTKAVVSTFVSTKIKGTADEVFSAIIDYNSYPIWSPFAIYEWENTNEEGVPLVGSTGNFKVLVDGVTRNVPIQLDILDQQNRVIAEESISYPNWLLKSERIQEVVPLDDEPGFCEYRTQHNLFGLASYYLLLTSKEDLKEIQTHYAREVKFFVESRNRFKTTKR